MKIPGVQPKSLTRQQKTGFVLLLVFGFLAISLGFLQMRNTIYNPFVIKSSGNNISTQAFLDDITRLQQVDTDQDGLTDYDELEFYQTSPYLPDTDSDGLPDKAEIENGTDPLCAEGSSCELPEPPKQTTEAESPLLEDLNSDQLMGEIGRILSEQEQADSEESFTNIDPNLLISDPDILRQLLLSTGQISEQQLAKIDDETILQLVDELAKSNQ
jgi:hypothetical protein